MRGAWRLLLAGKREGLNGTNNEWVDFGVTEEKSLCVHGEKVGREMTAGSERKWEGKCKRRGEAVIFVLVYPFNIYREAEGCAPH